MSSGRGIQRRRGRRKLNKAFELQLTSMMDVLVIIVVFLLKSYNTSMNSFSTARGLQLPVSASPDSPKDCVQVIITPEAVTVDNERVLDLVQTAGNVGSNDINYSFKGSDLDEGGRRIVPLYDALVKAKEKTELLLAKSQARVDGKPIAFEGVLAIQADKRIKFETLRKIMYTAGAAQYKVFKFLAMQKET